MAKRLPAETVLALGRRLERLAPRDRERARLVAATAALYGVTRSTLYRALQGQLRPKAAHRVDKGIPRAVPAATLERYCEIIAALKLRTTNGKGRHLSTARAIELLERHGVDTPDGHVQPAPGLLKKPTIDRHLRRLGYDQERMSRPPAAVRFEAERSPKCLRSWLSNSSSRPLTALATVQWTVTASNRTRPPSRA